MTEVAMSKVPNLSINGAADVLQLLARARYNNTAEAPDELTFRKGDIVTVLQKDFNNQVDWWLCELRGKRGMVPANYFEIFHDHDNTATYDIPRPSSKSSLNSSHNTPLNPHHVVVQNGVTPEQQINDNQPIYDFPPVDTEDIDKDYDMPPDEDDIDGPSYNRSPSAARSSPHMHGGQSTPCSSNRSSLKSSNRISNASSVGSNQGIYDVPPDPADVYNFPKPNLPPKGFEDENRWLSMHSGVDISTIKDDEADKYLTSYHQVVSSTYDSLYQAVYGPNAYWGTDNKPRRLATLQRTIVAVKHFDRAMVAFLEFGKGVMIALESSCSDTNFKKKYSNAFRNLFQCRSEIISKVESLNSEIDSVTATVKSLLEVARTVPKAVSEFSILVQANKALLFKTTKTSSNTLPVITKSEVKIRPLPELPNKPAQQTVNQTQTAEPEGDYAVPTDAEKRQMDESSVIDSGTLSRKRHPHDILPPLPYANTTLQKPGKTQAYQKTTNSKNNSPLSSPHHSQTNLQRQHSSPHTSHHQMTNTVRRERVMSGEDYDEIIEGRDRAYVITSRTSLGSGGSSRGASPVLRMRHEHSLSSCSGSSEDINNHLNLRRVSSADILDSGPYGRPLRNGIQAHHHHQRQISPPQPLRDEDRELLERFSKQLDLIIPSLKESIDIFCDCVRDNEPPKDFVTKSKLTVVAAYKLVYVADALTQKVLHNETKSSILASSNRLTDSIKNLVSGTKTAALQYPSVIALDKMSDSLRELYPSALDLINSVRACAAV